MLPLLANTFMPVRILPSYPDAFTLTRILSPHPDTFTPALTASQLLACCLYNYIRTPGRPDAHMPAGTPPYSDTFTPVRMLLSYLDTFTAA